MNEITATKICPKCKFDKDIALFSNNKNTKDGLQYKCKQCVKEYESKNKIHISKIKNIHYQNNKQIKSKKSSEYYKKNKEIVLEKSREYYRNNKQRKIDYQTRNKEAIAKRKQKYQRSEFGKVVCINSAQKRRSIKRHGDVTNIQLLELQKNAKVCYWCNKSLKNLKVHIDHYIALSKGGEHTLGNLVVSCQKCNNQKHAKDPIEFANSIGKLL